MEQTSVDSGKFASTTGDLVDTLAMEQGSLDSRKFAPTAGGLVVSSLPVSWLLTLRLVVGGVAREHHNAY